MTRLLRLGVRAGAPQPPTPAARLWTQKSIIDFAARRLGGGAATSEQHQIPGRFPSTREPLERALWTGPSGPRAMTPEHASTRGPLAPVQAALVARYPAGTPVFDSVALNYSVQEKQP